ncbi:unnamed protein product [Rotaria socialis]|uniref:J domain-containing protein n=2 Tax=Rotaria socialis TaxID=392032 RepID=A0A819XPD4_9BILA|nr:unnamed protein product [Rotaria socialis]CAF3337160.1 unnamed protein product [Rotaria socialis]CAF3423575.1 unnamed protein product [Rotaria socialis]CAF3577232.1 unnamed protein product [Rotaria socialis]CAF4145051.1 unnamed protein product [Rotaria socialis]
MVSNPSMMDYYKELGITRHAIAADIRTAYKRLALLWHPDRNKDSDAEEKFKKIKQAYDVLSDDNRRREYDEQRAMSSQRKRNARFETKKAATTNMNYTEPNQDSFNLHTFDQFMSTPIDPFDILNDIQFFQDSDFTSKMTNSSSYRNLYTQIFNSMNNNLDSNRHMPSSSPIYLNNDRLFRQATNTRSKHHFHHKRPSTKFPSANPIQVIHSTMPNEWFLNELIDLHEHQNVVNIQPSYSPFNNDSFFNDLTHCTNCHKKISVDRTRLIQHEQQCRQNMNRHTTMPSKSVRV